MKLLQRWRQTAIANQLMVITTTIVAFGTLFYAAAAIFQIYILNKSAEQTTKQTDKLIAATQRLADTTVDALNEAKKSNKETAEKVDRLIEANKSLADSGKRSAGAAKISAAAATTVIGQNERLMKAAETQASASQITATINSQLTAGYYPKLVSLIPNQPMIVDIYFINKSNFVVSVTSGIAQYIFTENRTATANFDSDATPLPVFQLAPQWEGISVHISSRILSEQEVSAIREGPLQVYLFMRFTIQGVEKPLDACYHFSKPTKDFVACANLRMSQ